MLQIENVLNSNILTFYEMKSHCFCCTICINLYYYYYPHHNYHHNMWGKSNADPYYNLGI